MSKEIKTIKASAVIQKVTTTVDGGAAITLHISEEHKDAILELMDLKFKNGIVAVAIQECIS